MPLVIVFLLIADFVVVVVFASNGAAAPVPRHHYYQNLNSFFVVTSTMVPILSVPGTCLLVISSFCHGFHFRLKLPNFLQVFLFCVQVHSFNFFHRLSLEDLFCR
jgi:hypothetical protein